MNNVPAFWAALICSNIWAASSNEYGGVFSVSWMCLVVLIMIEEYRAIKRNKS